MILNRNVKKQVDASSIQHYLKSTEA